MKKIIFILVVGIAVTGALFLQRSEMVSSQVVVVRNSDGIDVLRDKSLRKTDPKRVIKAIDEVGAPYLARPVTVTDPIPEEVLSALVDLLDFEYVSQGNPEFDISAGQKTYPVTKTLVFMRTPVLPALVEVIENEDSKSVKSQNAVMVIQRIEGDNIKTFNYLKVQAAGAKSEMGRQKLLSAADKVLKDQRKLEQQRVQDQ